MASTVIQRSAIKNLDWFDERMKLFEDACFFLRLAYKFKTDYCDEPLVKYRVRPDSGTIVHFGNLPYERDLALKTFTDDFPSFEKEHKQDIKIFQSKTNAQRAINEWNNNNPKNARKILRNTNYKSLLIYALFFVTFLPTTTFKTFFILNYKIKSWFNWYNFE